MIYDNKDVEISKHKKAMDDSSDPDDGNLSNEECNSPTLPTLNTSKIDFILD